MLSRVMEVSTAADADAAFSAFAAAVEPRLRRAFTMLRGMAGATPQAMPLLSAFELGAVAVIMTSLVAVHWRMRDTTLEAVVARVPAPVLATAWAAMAFAVAIEQGEGNAFIYFQF